VRITISQEDCINTEEALRKEWLDTNGLGGYASSTILHCHTRKYHGLLVACLKEPQGRFVLLSKIETSVLSERREFHLSTNKYPGVFYPTGHKYIEEFTQGLAPTTSYKIADVLISKSVMMASGENTVLVKYSLREGRRSLILRLKPLLAYRDIHALMRENMSIQVKTYAEKNGFKIEPYQGMPPLYVYTSKKSVFHPAPEWFCNMEYLKERRRGYDYKEDLFCPGMFEVTLQRGKDLILAASTHPHKSANLEKKFKRETARRRGEFNRFAQEPERTQTLKYLAGQFIIRNRHNERSIAAGYHWFGEWGRDAMIAVPGLTFYCQRMDEGVEILDTFARREYNGLLPNFISEKHDGNAYNSADASLWFFWTVQEYFRKGGDPSIVKKHFFTAMQNIVKSILARINPLLKLHENGLVGCGSEETQFTWMDAVASGRPVTPRHGFAVEINALWYNAVKFLAELSRDYGEDHAELEIIAKKIENAFIQAFWNEEKHCLYDVVRDGYKDAAVRPNQIFAVSLPFSPVPEENRNDIVNKVTADLLTPYGLRTLSPADPNYKPRYEGSQDDRDSAYHQGTVWPWLAGHFGEAFLRVSEDQNAACEFLQEHLQPLLEEFPENFGVAGMPEIYNGTPPYKPKGCIHQAWSLAEVIRLRSLMKVKGEG